MISWHLYEQASVKVCVLSIGIYNKIRYNRSIRNYHGVIFEAKVSIRKPISNYWSFVQRNLQRATPSELSVKRYHRQCKKNSASVTAVNLRRKTLLLSCIALQG